LTAKPNESARKARINEAFEKLVQLVATVPTGDRVKLMRLALTNATTIATTTLRWFFAVRTELTVFLPVDHLKASPSVIAHLEDTRTEKEIAFALDRMINELGNVTPSETSGDTP